MTAIEFRESLKEGLTISEACHKHNTTLLEVFTELHNHKPHPKKYQRKPKKASRYIQKRGDKYYLRKTVRGKVKLFGIYYTLEDAINMREYCTAHGWKPRKIDEYCETLGINRSHRPRGRTQ